MLLKIPVFSWIFQLLKKNQTAKINDVWFEKILNAFQKIKLFESSFQNSLRK